MMSVQTTQTQEMVRPSRHTVEARFRTIRLAAHGAAEALVTPVFTPTIRLTGIGPDALDAFERFWALHPNRRCAWPWREMESDFRHAEPSRFDLAVWSGDVLCGLAVGRTRADHCRMDYLEGSPIPGHPLMGRVVLIAAAALVAYATALGKSEARLVDPLPALVPYYEGRGFKLANPKGEARYCSWRIR